MFDVLTYSYQFILGTHSNKLKCKSKIFLQKTKNVIMLVIALSKLLSD